MQNHVKDKYTLSLLHTHCTHIHTGEVPAPLPPKKLKQTFSDTNLWFARFIEDNNFMQMLHRLTYNIFKQGWLQLKNNFLADIKHPLSWAQHVYSKTYNRVYRNKLPFVFLLGGGVEGSEMTYCKHFIICRPLKLWKQIWLICLKQR